MGSETPLAPRFEAHVAPPNETFKMFNFENAYGIATTLEAIIIIIIIKFYPGYSFWTPGYKPGSPREGQYGSCLSAIFLSH